MICNIYRRAKEVRAEKDRRAAVVSKAATALDRSTRRRTNFDFDLWDVEGKATDTSRNWIITQVLFGVNFFWICKLNFVLKGQKFN